MLGVLAMFPLMQYVAGFDPDSGILGTIKDLIGDPSPRALLILLATTVLLTFVVKDVVSLLFRRWQLHFMADQEVTLSTRVLRGYLTGPFSWHADKTTGDKVFTVEGAVGGGYTSGLASALAVLTEVATVSVIVMGLLLASPIITLLCVGFFSVGALLMNRWIKPYIINAAERSRITGMATSRFSLQALGATKEVKLRRAHEHFVDGYRLARWEGAHARATASLYSDLPKYFLELMFISAIGLIAVISASGGGGADVVVLLGVFVAAGTRIVPSAVRLMSAFNGIKSARPLLEMLVEVVAWQRVAVAEDAAEVRTSQVPTGEVELTDVHFRYGTTMMEVLQGISLRIPTGTSVALAGSSGAGKTTLVDLLLGLHKPTEGQITAGGLNIRDNLPGWQSQLAVVPQEVYLMDDTLARNIAFELDIDDDLLVDVINRSQLADLVAELPDGLDTWVGERGTRLSGGQRQRIGIARALYRQPRYLFLDEATSALDNETERRLTQTIEALKGTMTIVIVAHRLSTVRHCDQLIFMSRGRVAAAGTFDEVAEANDEFANLVRLGSLSGDPVPPGNHVS